MSCNGCRVLRKGCSDSCILRSSLLWIESPEAQGHATVFVAKFFGRAGMISFINAVPESQRPALFQSLLYEACGRTVNPVFGAVGLLWSGNWAVCQAAVETVLKGGSLKPSSTLGNPSIIKPNMNTPIPTKLLHPAIETLSSSSHPPTLVPTSAPLIGNDNPDPNPNADVDPHPNPLKRPRSSPPLLDTQRSASEPKPENHNVNPHSSALADETLVTLPCEKAVKEVSTTPNLVAPVARRVRPVILPGHNIARGLSNHATFIGSDRPSSSEMHDNDTSAHVDRDNNVECVVELNLTLNSLANSGSMCKHSNGSSPTYRVSSPCSFSEGSVTTSLDTAELPVSCFRAALSPQGALNEEPQLLKLL